MARVLPLLAAAGAGVLLLCLLWLGRLEAGGPAHRDLVLPGDVPATLYLPQPSGPWAPYDLPAPPPRGERPAAVVLVHGFAGDRAGVSSLARRLAAGGYAVLAPDLRGHGANRNPFGHGPESRGNAADVAAAVDWLRTSAYVDGARIAVAGHSMGASAVLRFAEGDSGIDAAVMISGGHTLSGPYRPPNALLLVAQRDPAGLRARVGGLAARLAGVAEAEPGRRYGSFEHGDAVRLREIPGVDHGAILWSEEATVEILGWLDAAFGIAPAGRRDLAEPRLRVVAPVLLALPFVLIGVGLVLGGLAPRWPGEERGGWAGLAWLALALLAALPLVGVAPLGRFLGLAVADRVVALLGLAGVALLAGFGLAGRGPLSGPGGWRSVAAGLVAAAAAYAALAPVGVLVHRLVPTPERALAGLVAALLLLPFFLGFETALRRGPPGAALLRCIAGRLLVLAVLLLGAALGILPPVVLLMLGALGLVFALLELVAATAWPRSRNRLAIATFESLVLAWILAAVLPVG